MAIPSDPALLRDLMGAALEEAEAAPSHGDVPIGAVVATPSGRVVARRHNEREAASDPTAHAEILALRDAGIAAGDWRLPGHLLVVTVEPCPMCAGAAVLARLDAVVFGTRDAKAGAAGSLYNLAADPRLNHEMAVVGGVLEDRCASLVSRFFASRRSPGPGTEPVE